MTHRKSRKTRPAKSPGYEEFPLPGKESAKKLKRRVAYSAERRHGKSRNTRS